MTLIQAIPEGHVEGHPIERRMVRFDWTETPAHWVPGDPFASHVINVLHLLLPAGETWFIEVVNRVRSQVTDAELQEAIKPFIQQESWHAQAHQHVLDALDKQGIDSKPYTDRLEKNFEGFLAADHPTWPSWAQTWMERRNLAAVAAIEHFTAVLGHWILTHYRLDEDGADPQMLDLLRWHGAEEVEHRALVFDVHPVVDRRRALPGQARPGVERPRSSLAGLLPGRPGGPRADPEGDIPAGARLPTAVLPPEPGVFDQVGAGLPGPLPGRPGGC